MILLLKATKLFLSPPTPLINLLDPSLYIYIHKFAYLPEIYLGYTRRDGQKYGRYEKTTTMQDVGCNLPEWSLNKEWSVLPYCQQLL